jgi:hypothetical protein
MGLKYTTKNTLTTEDVEERMRKQVGNIKRGRLFAVGAVNSRCDGS